MVQEFTNAANDPTKQVAADEAEQDKAERLFSMADAVGQEFYGVGPSMGPERLRDVARMMANFEGRLEGTNDWTIGGSGGGRIGQSLQDRLREKDKEDQEWFAEKMGEIAEQQQREREEWARTDVSFAGITMTGAKWGELGEELRREGELRNGLVQRLMQEGKTREEAERRATEMADVARALGKPPSQRTDAERAAITQAEQDPDFRRHMTPLAQSFGAGSAPASARQRQATNTGQQASVTTGADVLDAGSISVSAERRTSDFPSAPRATEHHRAAVAAREPLDAPSPPTTRVAAAPAAPSAGFDAV